MRISIIGGAGFIGSAVIRYVIENTDHAVINIDKLTYAGNLESLVDVAGHSRYHFEQVDICDRGEVQRVFKTHRPEAVMHLAAESHVDRSIEGPAEFIQTNIVGTCNLLEASRACWSEAADKSDFRFHHISTDEVYGSLGESGLFTETTAYDPSSPYSASKTSSDHLARALYKALINGHIGEAYNIGGNNEKTNLEVVNTICVILDELVPELPREIARYEELITHVDDRPGHDLRYAIDASKIQRELDWTPVETFESGIRKTVQWYLANRDWWQHVLDGSYQRECLGLIAGSEA